MNQGPEAAITAELVRVSGLTSEQRALWRELQAASPLLRDGFFSLEFVEAVAALREDVWIVILKRGGDTAGFLPIEKRGRIAAPVASRVSEVHGAIAPDDLNWDMSDVLRQIGVQEWNFVCAPAWQQPLRKWSFCEDDLPYVCLRDGFEGLQENLRKRQSRALSQTSRKARKIEREQGALRFEFQAADRDAVLNQLIAWKSDHFKRLGVVDPFAFTWVEELARTVCAASSPGLTGVLSALYLEDRLIAAHLGMKGFDTLNCWYPAYAPDPSLAKYSPGQILLVKLLEAANGHGIARYHFGRGPEAYKARFRTGGYPILEGSVNTRALPRAVRKTAFRLREFADNSPFLAWPLRCIRRGKQAYALRNTSALRPEPSQQDRVA